MFTDIMGIVIDTEDKWLNKKLNSHICYKGGVGGMGSTSMPEQGIFGRLTETSDSSSGGLSSSSSSGGLEQGSSKVAEARTQLEGALGALQGLKDGSSKVCSCGKPRGKCNCKGYADGVKSVDELMKEYREKMNSPTETTEEIRSMISEKQKKGYAYGTKMASPMGYYMGDSAVDTSQEEQEAMAFQGTQAQIDPNLIPQEESNPVQEEVMAEGVNAIKDEVMGKDGVGSKLKERVMETGPMQKMFGGSGVAGLGEAATKGSAGMQALGGAGTAVVGDLLTKGKVDSGTLKKAAVGAIGNMLLPGFGGVIGSALGGLFKDGTPEVPPMGYAGGVPDVDNQYAREAAKRAEMSPEEIQEQFLKQKVLPPLMQRFEEASVPAKVAMAAIPAGLAYETGRLPLGQFRGGKLEGGRDRVSYKHPKFGDFEVNPESERVSYRKTFRF